MHTYYGLFTAYGYEILRRSPSGTTEQVYSAGNCQYDSAQTLPPGTLGTLDIATIEQYCEDTGRQMAAEAHGRWAGCSHDAEAGIDEELNRVLDSGDLEISVTATERQVLRRMHNADPNAFQTDDTMRDLFEPLICNSELDWCRPEEISALTSAPILCIRRDDEITDAWGFMDYALRSPQDDLLAHGKAIFQRG